MKIILIRQAEPDMKWEENYDAAGFASAVESVRNRCTSAKPVRRSDATAYRVYIGTSRAAGETAELLFELAEPPVKTPLLDDVPAVAMADNGLYTMGFRQRKTSGIGERDSGAPEELCGSA